MLGQASRQIAPQMPEPRPPKDMNKSVSATFEAGRYSRHSAVFADGRRQMASGRADAALGQNDGTPPASARSPAKSRVGRGCCRLSRKNVAAFSPGMYSCSATASPAAPGKGGVPEAPACYPPAAAALVPVRQGSGRSGRPGRLSPNLLLQQHWLASPCRTRSHLATQASRRARTTSQVGASPESPHDFAKAGQCSSAAQANLSTGTSTPFTKFPPKIDRLRRLEKAPPCRAACLRPYMGQMVLLGFRWLTINFRAGAGRRFLPCGEVGAWLWLVMDR